VVFTPLSYLIKIILVIEKENEMATNKKITEVRTVQKESSKGGGGFSFKASQVVGLIFGLLEAVIVLRILFKFFGANPNNPIAALVTKVTDVFLAPFAGLFAPLTIGGMVFELSSFIALLIYAVIGWAIVKLITVIFYRSRGPVEKVTETTSSDESAQK
jgi:uncharacterized protein YggT (Ycf19 family)